MDFHDLFDLFALASLIIVSQFSLVFATLQRNLIKFSDLISSINLNLFFSGMVFFCGKVTDLEESWYGFF